MGSEFSEGGGLATGSSLRIFPNSLQAQALVA